MDAFARCWRSAFKPVSDIYQQTRAIMDLIAVRGIIVAADIVYTNRHNQRFVKYMGPMEQ